MMRNGLLVLAWLLIASAAVWAESGDKLYVLTHDTRLYAGPGRDHAVTMELAQGHELVELQRAKPGRNRVLGDDFKYSFIEVDKDEGEWIEVGVADMGGKIGWVPAVAVGSDLPAEAKEAQLALWKALARLQANPCVSKLQFKKLYGNWYVQAPGTAKIHVDRWLGVATSDEIQEMVQQLGGGQDVPMVTLLRFTGECP